MEEKENKPKESSSLSEEEFFRRLSKIKPMGVNLPKNMNPSLTDKDSLDFELSQKKVEGFKKEAQLGLVSPVGPTAFAPLLYWDPLLDPALFLWPKDRIDEINKRLRHYAETHPIVSALIHIHSSFPLSDFTLEVEDKEIQNYYNDFKDRKKLLEVVFYLAKDYWTLGEAFFYGLWDVYNFEWLDFVQIPPENIDIYGSYVSGIFLHYLKPDPQLVALLSSTKIEEKELVKYLDPEFIDAIKHNKPYLLRNDRLITIARKLSKYSRRGVSIIRSVLKELMVEDKLRILQLTFCDRYLFPLRIFKLGVREKGWIPPLEDFQLFQSLLLQAASDPSFSIIYHFGVEVEVIGQSDKIANLNPHFDMLEKRIIKGLMGSETMLAGDIPGYASSMVNLRVIMHNYMILRELIEKELIYKIFFKLAKARGYKKRTKAELAHKVRTSSDLKFKDPKDIKEGETALILYQNIPVYVKKVNGFIRIAEFVISQSISETYYLPKIIWRRQNLYNNTTMIDYILRLRREENIPISVVFDVLGLDENIIKKWAEEEKNTLFDPIWKQTLSKIIQENEEVRDQILEGKNLKEIIKNYLAKKQQEKIKEEKSTEPITIPTPTFESPQKNLNIKKDLDIFEDKPIPKPKGSDTFEIS